MPDSPTIHLAQEIIDIVSELPHAYPTIDFALVVMAKMLNLPDGSAQALFALGRTVGWIGHAIEQYNLNSLIRPRAIYTGRAHL